MLMLFFWLVCVMLIGWSVLSLIARDCPLSFAQSFALSYGLGVGLVSIEMPILSFLGIKFTVFSLMIWWAPLIVWALFRMSQDYSSLRPHTQLAGCGGSNLKKIASLEKFFIFGISLETLYVFFRALIKPMEAYDAVAIYALKSKIFYLARAVPHNFFSAFKDIVPHIEYPLLIPLAETSFYVFLGSLNDLLVKIIFPLYYTALLVLFYAVLRRFLGRKPSLLFTFFLATIPQITDFATNGYADMPFAFYCSASFFCLYLWLRQNEDSVLVLSFIFSVFGAWTKAEGLMFAVINAAIVIISMLRERRLRAIGMLFTAVSLFAVMTYVLALRSIGLTPNSDFTLTQGPLISKIIIGFKRMPAILYEYQIQFFGPKKWNIIWMLFIAGFVLGFKKIFSKEIFPATLAMVFIFAGYSIVYMFSSAPQGFGWHLSTSGSRLFMHFLPIAVLWLALLFKELKLEI